MLARMPPVRPPILLFHRRYRSFQGGHLKLRDYIGHTAASGLFAPALHMAESAAGHPFADACPLWPAYRPERAAALFLAGMDWDALPCGEEHRRPVINLLQGLRHADPADRRFAFLARPAIRLCVSSAVAEAVRATGQASGPVLCLPAGVDLAEIPCPASRPVAVVVAGLKRPDLARAIAARLAPALPVDCLTQPLPRPAFLARLGAARIAITLPEVAEGCFLPALEAMAAGCAVICPDAGGNRDFCRDGETCLMPPATPPDLADAACALLADGAWAARLAAAGRAEAARRSLAAERAAFIAVLASVASRLSPAAV